MVAASQEKYSPNIPHRVGFFTVSNIVAEGNYFYTLIMGEGMLGMVGRSVCLFRTDRHGGPSNWLGWDGSDFTVDLSKVGQGRRLCKPVEGLSREIRGLVRHRDSGIYVTVFNSKEQSQSGVFYSTSSDLTHWSKPRLLLEAPLTREPPDCKAVYRYPALIDHNAPELAFESIGDSAHLYSVKIILEKCRPIARLVTRIPISVTDK